VPVLKFLLVFCVQLHEFNVPLNFAAKVQFSEFTNNQVT
jgi:hypothetical protein